MFTEKDQSQLKAHGLSVETAESQMRRFSEGFPYLTLGGSATKGQGILVLDPISEGAAITRWRQFLTDGGEVAKFVPASGAASRMFKALFAFVDGKEEKAAEGSPVAKLLAGLDSLPFLAELTEATKKLYDLTPQELMEAGRQKDIIRAIIAPEGLNYGSLPKAMLTFHRYEDHTRTPLEEHLAEGAQTAASNGVVNLHFTVSADHRKLFEEKIKETVPAMEKRFGVKYNISLSEQKPSTDTIAADLDSKPFRKASGDLVFRPGGHGALIENLNDMDSAVVFIKNIDNVVPDTYRQATIRYKEVLAGILILAHDKATRLLADLLAGNHSEEKLAETIAFLRETFRIESADFDRLKGEELAKYLIKKLDRPMRACGMVRNDGEPGGGPFIAQNPDGSFSLQILESTQIDPSTPEAMAMMQKATHFNPVDLVCYIKRPDGTHFNLPDYVDHNTGFISSKSYEGRELQALELPGLWNGAMSDWNTLFVEVPIETFNPVKTVNDLLRPAHQA